MAQWLPPSPHGSAPMLFKDEVAQTGGTIAPYPLWYLKSYSVRISPLKISDVYLSWKQPVK